MELCNLKICTRLHLYSYLYTVQYSIYLVFIYLVSLAPVKRLTSLLVRLRSVLSLVLAVVVMKAWLKGHIVS